MSSKLLTRLSGLTVGLTACSLVPLTGFAAAHSEGAALQEEIVVTARRREESLLEIPVAVSTLNQDEIIERGVFDTQDLSAFTPGFQLQNFGQGGTSGRNNPNIRFRGLGVQAASPAARAGAIFWDGAYISDGVGILPLFDLERVEVIKGPQTAFFGRNTFAGAVNYIPSRPGDEINGRLISSFAPDSDGDGYELSGSIGGPITDSLGFRVAGSLRRRGADYEYRDGSPLGEEDTAAFFGQLEFAPTDDLSLRLGSFIVDASDTRSTATQLSNNPGGTCNRSFSGRFRQVGGGVIPGSDFTTDISQKQQSTFCGELPDWDSDSEVRVTSFGDDRQAPLAGSAYDSDGSIIGGASNNVRTLPVEFGSEDMPDAPNGFGNEYEVWRVHFAGDYALNNGLTLAGFVSHGESGFWSILDSNNGFNADGTVNPAGFARKVKDTSYELRLASSGERRLRWQVGINYYEQEIISTNFTANCFGPCGARADMDLQDGDNLGIFGSVDFDITDDLTFSFEGRWAEDTQTILYQGFTTERPDLIGAPPVTNVESSFSEFMPRVILSWQPIDSGNLYGSYSKSYLQGLSTDVVDYAEELIPDDPGDPGNTQPAEDRAALIAAVGLFTPTQELDAFEIGWKQQVGILDYSVAVYYMDWQNQTFFDLSLPSFRAVNLAGDAEYTGIEFEWNAAITDWFTFSGGFNFVDAEFTDFGGAGSLASEVLAPGQQSLFGNPPGVNPPLRTINPTEQIDATGNRPRYIEDTTAFFSFDFNFPLGNMGFYTRADAIWSGDFYADNFEWNEVEGSWRLNLRGGVELTENVRAEIYGLNVTDDRSYLSSGGSTGISFTAPADRRSFSILPQAREVGVRLIANF